MVMIGESGCRVRCQARITLVWMVDVSVLRAVGRRGPRDRRIDAWQMPALKLAETGRLCGTMFPLQVINV